jgi:DHA2 family multidrug resistance protein-like MFS transporter
MLIVARALLGIAGATLAPSTLSLISNMFRDAHQRGIAIGVWASSFTVGAILGPVVGGLVLAQWWWGAVFLLPIPIMVLLLVVGPFLIPEFKAPSAGRLDAVSVLLSLGAMLAFIYGVKELAAHGVQVVPVLVALLGLGLGAAFVRRQGRLADPMLDLGMFRNRTFSSVLIGLVLYSMVGASSTLFITQHFLSVAGLSAFMSALYLIPGMVVMTVSTMASPWLARFVRPAYLIGFALFGVVATFGALTQLSPASPAWVLVVALAVIGLCQGPLISLGTGLVVGSVPVEQSGAASAVSQTANEAGAAVGVALMGSLGTAVYRSVLSAGSVPDAARENVATAVAVAQSLPSQAGEALAAAARAAFTQSFATYAFVAAGFALATALVVLIRVRHVPAGGAGGGH